MLPSVRDATAADVPAAAETLAAAFEDYPWTRWMIPGQGYPARLEELQAIYLHHAVGCGLVLADTHGRGIGAFLPPDAPPPGSADQARIAELLGDRLDTIAAVTLPPRPPGFWELATIGVHPRSWGKGVATSILAEGLRRLDAVDASTWLETSETRNVALYRRHGFALMATTRIPDGPVVHSMARELRA